MINRKSGNSTMPQVTENIAKWHHDRNLVEGTTTWNQSKKLLEEFVELVAAQMPGQSHEAIANKVREWVTALDKAGRIKTVQPENAQAALKDAIGDMYVVQANISEREEFSMADAAHAAYTEIKDRKGQMVDGMYVKEDDLTQ